MNRALTLVRFWENYDDCTESVNVFVHWKDGSFLLPVEYPLARYLIKNVGRRECRLTVYSTDELEWVVDQVDTDIHEVSVNCIPRLKRLRHAVISDDYLVEMWLDAEKRHTNSAGFDASVNELAQVMYDQIYSVSKYQWPWFQTVARKLVESGWRKGDPT
jgi:hypothetical protein